MNQKWLSSVLLCTHHLRGLTEVEEGDHFWEEGDHFLHGVFPYIRNPTFYTHESVRVRGILRLLHMYKHSRPIVPVLPFSPSIERKPFLALSKYFSVLCWTVSSRHKTQTHALRRMLNWRQAALCAHVRMFVTKYNRRSAEFNRFGWVCHLRREPVYLFRSWGLRINIPEHLRQWAIRRIAGTVLATVCRHTQENIWLCVNVPQMVLRSPFWDEFYPQMNEFLEVEWGIGCQVYSIKYRFSL